MSWMNTDARLDAEDCIRMMRFMAQNIRDERKTVEKCVKTYQRMFPDWKQEGNEKHHFFYDVTFIQDAIHDFSFWPFWFRFWLGFPGSLSELIFRRT